MENTIENTITDTSTEITVEETAVNTTLIEEKLDTIIGLETQQTSTILVSVGLLAAIIVSYLLYKFVAKFFEF